MKSLILIPFASLMLLLSSFSLFSTYEAIMKENIEKIYTAKSSQELTDVINTFTRVAQKEKDKWEPFYYASFGYLKMMGTTEAPEEQDKYLDLALENAQEGLNIAENEDELHALLGYIHMMRVSINPGVRGQKYTALSMESLSKAAEMDLENPRALYLLGRMEMGVAQFFGSDLSQACGKIKNSLLLFENEDKESSLAPSWGELQAKEVAKYCDK